MAGSTDAENPLKKARVEAPDALLKLQSAVQDVIASVTASMAQSALPKTEVEATPQVERRDLDINDLLRLSEHMQKESKQRPDGLEKVRERINQLNTKGGFAGKIHAGKITAFGPYVDLPFMMKVLRDLEERRHSVKDPTAFVTAALSRVAENKASPHSKNPVVKQTEPDYFSNNCVDLNVTASHDAALAAMQFQMFQASMGSGMIPGAISGMPMFGLTNTVPHHAALSSFASPIGATPSCIPPGNAALMQKSGTASTGTGSRSCIPPGNAALLKKSGGPHVSDVEEAKPSPPEEASMFAQQAEEAAQAAASAAALCVSLSGEQSSNSEMLIQTAEQSAKRAAWALTCFNSRFPASQDANAEWLRGTRQMITDASARAQHAAGTCRAANDAVLHRQPEGTRDDKERKKPTLKVKICHGYASTGRCSKGRLCTFAHGEEEIGTPQPILTEEQKAAPAPCKFFVTSWCRNGATCEYSHDLTLLEPRPLVDKKPVSCVYFEKGICTRGAGCYFSHGNDELAKVRRVLGQ